ncbi:AzlC family ABC transporter permease [Alicyclobacillus acidiphilus]|uniref:AzlC family ABC transporter permease n=1 Tax=Alicyclobacillus acidiphilus TaxID=182455 RepID=UPI0008295E1E|nr:AzlC family ABC transporter permease [Alicyclobacillus acidiphilus]
MRSTTAPASPRFSDTPATKGFRRALADTFPLSLSVFAYGTAYGALAHSADHLTFLQTIAMSAFVFAGASQFTILSLLHQGAAVWTILFGALLINARQILYGLTLGHSLKHLRVRDILWLAHGMTDESYSVTMVEATSTRVKAAYFAGAGTAIFGPWLLSSSLGFAIGGLIGDPARFGLDYAYIGAFLGLLASQVKSGRHVVAAISAAATSTAAYHFLGTSGAVFAGAITAFCVGVYKR